MHEDIKHLSLKVLTALCLLKASRSQTDNYHIIWLLPPLLSYDLLLISVVIKIISSVSGGKVTWMRLPEILSDADTGAVMRILMKT